MLLDTLYTRFDYSSDGFPRHLFPETIKPVPAVVKLSAIDELEHKLESLLDFSNNPNIEKSLKEDTDRLKVVIEKLTEYSYELDALNNKP